MDTIILIPPSEGKAIGGEYEPINEINPITKALLDEINKTEPSKLYGLQGKALEQAIKTHKEILTSKTLPAIKRYTGVVYEAIEYETLKNKKLFDQRIRIISGLFGLITPQTLIPNYRLKINKLSAAKKWLEAKSLALENKFVIDLLPKDHKKAVTYKQGIEVEFVLKKNGKKMPAGHQGKHIKGRFVRWLIEKDVVTSSRFNEFREEGYRWTGEYFLKEL